MTEVRVEQVDTLIQVEELHGLVEILPDPAVQNVVIEVPGPIGPQGIPGPPGPTGEDGTGVDAYFEYPQNNPSDTWGPINHGFGRYPQVGAKDSAGTDLEPGVYNIDRDNTLLTYSSPQSGVAWFS